MVNSLKDITGCEASFDDLEGLVLNGFPKEILEYCDIKVEDVKLKVDRYKLFRAQCPEAFYLLNKLCP